MLHRPKDAKPRLQELSSNVNHRLGSRLTPKSFTHGANPNGVAKALKTKVALKASLSAEGETKLGV